MADSGKKRELVPQSETLNSVTAAALLVLPFAVYALFNPSMIADLRAYSFDDGSYSHAYLIPPLIFWLYWDALRQGALTPRVALAWVAPLLLTLFAVLVTRFAQIPLLERLLVPFPVVFGLLVFFRPNAALLLPVSLLWFITPVWGVMNPFLQALSTTAVEAIMRQTGIPTLVEGSLIQIPAGIFEIAEGCSGLRYVISALALAVVYCHLHLSRWRSMFLFVFAALVGAMLTNWLRIVLLILIGHVTEMRSPIIGDHNMFGWFLFIPLMFVLMWFGGRLDREPKSNGHALAAFGSSQRYNAGSGKAILVVLLPFVALSDAGHALLADQRLLLYQAPLDVEEMVVQAPPPVSPHPVVYRYDTVYEWHESTASGAAMSVAFRYEFDGRQAASRPDFFLNKLVPEGWRECGKLTTSAERFARYRLCRGQEDFAIMDYGYKVHGHAVYTSRDLKLARLRAALRLQRGSTLLWGWRRCEFADCSAVDVVPPVFRPLLLPGEIEAPAHTEVGG